MNNSESTADCPGESTNNNGESSNQELTTATNKIVQDDDYEQVEVNKTQNVAHNQVVIVMAHDENNLESPDCKSEKCVHDIETLINDAIEGDVLSKMNSEESIDNKSLIDTVSESTMNCCDNNPIRESRFKINDNEMKSEDIEMIASTDQNISNMENERRRAEDKEKETEQFSNSSKSYATTNSKGDTLKEGLNDFEDSCSNSQGQLVMPSENDETNSQIDSVNSLKKAQNEIGSDLNRISNHADVGDCSQVNPHYNLRRKGQEIVSGTRDTDNQEEKGKDKSHFWHAVGAVGKQIKQGLNSLVGQNESKKEKDEIAIKLQECFPPNNIVVNFHVLIKKSLYENKDVYIVFGYPVGNWKIAMLLMKPEPLNEYLHLIHLSGSYSFEKKYCEKFIPYKYVLRDPKTESVKWEQFFEDHQGGYLNRCLKISSSNSHHYNQYDDYVTIKKYDTRAHTTGRERAFVVYCLAALDFENDGVEQIVYKIQSIYATLCQSSLIDNKQIVESFGRTYRPDQALKAFLERCTLTLEKSSLESFNNAIILTMFLSENEFADSFWLRKIFQTFKRMVIWLSTNNQSISNFHISEDFLVRFLIALVTLINRYISFMSKDNWVPPSPCIYAYALARSIPKCEQFINAIKFGYLKKGLSYTQKNEMREILNVVEKLPECDLSFKHEFLELCPPDIFMELISSKYLRLFPKTLLFDKLCNLLSENSLILYNLKSNLNLLNEFLLPVIPQLENQTIYLWQESIRKCLSSEFIRDHEIFRFYFSILVSLKKSINSEGMPELCAANHSLFESLSNIVIANLKTTCRLKSYFETAELWSRYLDLFSCLEDKLYFENVFSAFKGEVINWTPSRCEREVIPYFTSLSEVVVDILFDLIFNDKSCAHSQNTFWGTILDRFGYENSPTGLSSKGSLLSRLIILFPFFPEPDERYSTKMFMSVTESDNLGKILTHIDTYQKYISTDATIRLTSILANLDFFVMLLETGNLNFNVLNNLSSSDRSNRLISIYDLFGKDIRKIIKIRLEEFEFVRINVDSIHKYFKSVEFLTDADLSLESFMKFDKEKALLKDYCIIRNIDYLNADTPKFIINGINAASISLMGNFLDHYECPCFRQMLKYKVQQIQCKQWTLMDSLDFVRSMINEFLEFSLHLSNGSLLLHEVVKYFNPTDNSKMKTDLDKIASLLKKGNDWVTPVLKKIQLFFSVTEMTKMAETMNETIQVLKVNCNSESLNKILELGGDSDDWLRNELNYLSDDMLTYKEMFSTWDTELLSAMKTLNKCANLIEWVRKNIDNAQELKVFIDLANISAGESDIEVDQVLCFQSAVMAYSGLLFDCIGECSLDQIFQSCNTLNNALERDKDISQKLQDSNRQVRWLESIKDRHGSVETSSLNLVNHIATNGEINVKTLSKPSSQVDVNISFEELHDNQSYKQTLSLDVLKELESKLMLISVSPEIKSQVDRFISVLHQLILMKRSLEQLLIAGCCLFSQLTVVGYFSLEREVSLRLDFGHKTGILTGHGKLEEELSVMILKFEAFVLDWNEYIMRMRTDCHLLNFYTTDQLVMLTRFIADMKFGRQVNKQQLLMLLSIICADIDIGSVSDAIKSSASTTLSEKEPSSAAQSDLQNDPEQNPKDTETEVKRDIKKVEDMVKLISESYGYEEENILACILQTGNLSNIEDIVDWCLSHENERATLEDFSPPAVDGSKELSEENQIDNVSESVATENEKFSAIQDLIAKVSNDYDLDPENVFAAILETGNIDDEDILAQWCCDNPDFSETISIEKLRRERILVIDNPEEIMETVANEIVETEDIVVEICESSKKQGSISEEITKMFLLFLESTNVTDAEDFVSFTKLNEILEVLHETVSTPVHRKLPPYLESGKPNLIVVKESIIHQTALMLYQLDEGKELPSIDEILICDNNTTPEELVLHCLRAFNDQSGKIFTFLNADKINFDNSCQLEKLFLKPVKNHDYCLVFLSAKEHDEHSYIANALLRYRVNMPKVTDLKEIRSYLHRHLINQEDNQLGYRIDPGKLRFRLISSVRSGEGKSLVTRRMSEHGHCPRLTISVHSDKVDPADIIETLYQRSQNKSTQNIYHIDLLSNVREGVQDLLFSLAVMGGVRDFRGQFWKCSAKDYYAVEIVLKSVESKCEELFQCLLPVMWCNSPLESLNFYQNNSTVPESSRFQATDRGLCHFMDYKTCISEECQRPYQYLDLFFKGTPLDQFSYKDKQGSLLNCLTVLTSACCLPDPTWMELSNFWKFLNVQLKSCEKSVFCNIKFVGDTLPGFKTFVVRFLVQMSKDFSTRSAIVTDESMIVPQIPDRNRWENNFHPYLFFNEDGHSLCFFGFKIKNCHLMDDRIAHSEKIISQNVMGRDLFAGLHHQGIDFNRNIHRMGQQDLRKFYLEELCKVFGVREVHECESGYELTADNVLKMLAIHMRFRADIPVMIMGETGTGKTRLIRFICDLQREGREGENMVIVKCHGGIESRHIYESVKRTIELAKKNTAAGIPQTVLFFDEANTTNAIGAIKEVMCDKMVNGEPIPDDVGIKFVAAVNPYREHSSEMIKKLENAGLGYHMKAENTEDKLSGKIPMRRLVYRVRELSPSILPLIWDFGKLDDVTEEKYIVQMVENRIMKNEWSMNYQNTLVAVLTTCQKIMHERKDECSFVSLRDVDRCLEILLWFVSKGSLIIDPIRNDSTITDYTIELPDDFIIQLILAVACSYYIRLEDREHFFSKILPAFTEAGLSTVDEQLFLEIIRACQDSFINELRLGATISRNEALKENVWIMCICIELKIPLFLVGKPGSSKSLAKTLVGDVMQGDVSYSPLFKHFKEIQLVSFQCSPLATADGILSTFRQCQTYQKKQNLNSFTSVVVLDEIGLAEDSPKMPLKTLHPLLEDGCVGDEMPEDYKKVGFIGISNWALDPAKMNRGIFVSRGKLSRNDLLKTARGICLNDDDMKHHLEDYLSDIVDAYLDICQDQEREYYGLRDFYSLIKMLYQSYQFHGEISIPNLKRSIYRCFGGYFGQMQPSEVFISKIGAIPIDMQTNKDINHFELVKSALTQTEENRYLLLLTKNNAALRILLENRDLFNQKVTLIFGSSFPHDQEYMQLCKNINRIKLAMEMGHTVILCNLTNLYESLYDALNQSYVQMGGSRYVDLGLGMHRVKCRVHPSFRLIVVAEDTDVFERFPIPLINRLEKHYLGMESLMSSELEEQKHSLEQWIARFSEIKPDSSLVKDFVQYTPEDVFMGFHKDVPASLLVQSNEENGLELAKRKLIHCACPDSISRLESSNLSSDEIEEVINIYHLEQQHTSLAAAVNSLKDMRQIFLQITTHSRLLTISSKDHIASHVGIEKENIKLISLHQIETEEQFRNRLDEYFANCNEVSLENVVIIQCSFDSRIQRSNLIECARCCIKEISDHYPSKYFAVVLLIQIPRIKGGRFVGFSCNPWVCLHLDEIHSEHLSFDIYHLKGKPASQIFEILEEKLFYKLLFEACPKSCSKIEPVDNQRIIERIKIVSLILKQSSLADRFMKAVRKTVVETQKLLEIRELRQQDLLVTVSLQSVYLREGHTFQQSLWLTLLNKIVPTFTTIIKCCDFGHGLDLFTEHNDWIQDFYMKVFEKLDIENETPSQLPSDYSCSLPFSWIIVSLFEKIYSNGQTNFPDVFYCAVKETDLGQELDRLFEVNEEAARLFIKDMIAIKFPLLTGNSKLLEILIDQMIEMARNVISVERVEMLQQNEIECDQRISAADVYLAFCRMTNCLKTLCDTITFYEKCSGKCLIDNLISSPDLAQIDTVAIDRILESLDPKHFDLIEPGVRKRWMKHVKQFQITVQKYLNYRTSEEIVQKYRRLEILSLFAEYVIGGQSNEAFSKKLKQSVNQLGLILRKSCDPRTNATFDKMVKILSKISIDTAKLIFCSGVDKCFICHVQPQEPVALPCGHVACLECLKETVSNRLSSSTDGKWNCPEKDCKDMYRADFQLVSSLECREAVEEHRLFRENMNVFFLEVLQRFTFCGSTTPEEAVIKTLLDFVVTSELPRQQQTGSKKLTPFSGDCIDSTPTIRSFIFQQILRGDWNCVDEFFNSFYSSMLPLMENSVDFKAEFCLLLLYSIEDSMVGRQQSIMDSFHMDSESRVTHRTSDFISKTIDAIPHEDPKTMTFLYKLKLCAMLRICLSYATELIHRQTSQLESLSELEKIQLERIQELMLTFDEEECLFKYLVKELADKHSPQSILEWKNQAVFQDMMHQTLRRTDFDYQPDYYSVIGGTYQQWKDQVNLHLTNSEKEEEEKVFNPPENQVDLLNFRLACFYFRSKVDESKPLGKKSDQLLSQMEDKSQTSSNDLTVSRNILQTIRSGISATDKTLYSVIFHFYEMMMLHATRSTGVMSFFYSLFSSPDQLVGSYFPTMPQDELQDILNLMYKPNEEHVTDPKLFKRVYQCRCGYKYAVANCGELNEQSKCPDCKSLIGRGGNSQVVSNFQDTTQTGHILGPVVSNQILTGVREQSSVQVAVLRFLMHSAMLLSGDKSNLSALILPRVTADQVDTFLLQHLRYNFSQLCRALGKSEDHTRIYLHLIIDRFTQYRSTNVHPLNSKEARQNWEMEFSNAVPLIPNLDEIHENFNNQIKIESEGRQSVIHKILEEEVVSDFEMNDLPYLSHLWKPRVRISLANINQKVSRESMLQKCPLLSLMIQNETELTMLHHLVSVLKLQSTLVMKFNRKLDISVLENKSIREFLMNFDDPAERESLKQLITVYLNVFNQLRQKLFTSNQTGRLAYEHYKSMDPACGAASMESSRCGLLFPSGFGFGLCAAGLVELLIESHNGVLGRYLSRFDENNSFVSPCIVDQSQLVAFEHHQLEMLLLVNSQYSLQSGRATEWSIDLDNLERQVENRFFVGRVLLDNRLVPQLHFPDDKSVKKLQLNIPQAPLPPSIQHLIESHLTSLPDLCLFLNHCQTLRNLLAITVTPNSNDSNLQDKSSLKSYVNIVQFRMASHMVSSRLLDSILLEHMDDLIVFLKVVRAKRMILLKQNPWQGLLRLDMQEDGGPELRRSLDEVLHHIPPSILLSRLYRFLEEYLLTGHIDNPDFPISDCIYEFLYELNDNHQETFKEFFPNSALIKHSASCFAYFVDQIESQK